MESDDEITPAIVAHRGNRKRKRKRGALIAKNLKRSSGSCESEATTTVFTKAEVYENPIATRTIRSAKSIPSSPDDKFSAMRGRSRSARRSTRGSPYPIRIPYPTLTSSPNTNILHTKHAGENDVKPATRRSHRPANVTPRSTKARRRSCTAAVHDDSIITDTDHDRSSDTWIEPDIPSNRRKSTDKSKPTVHENVTPRRRRHFEEVTHAADTSHNYSRTRQQTEVETKPVGDKPKRGRGRSMVEVNEVTLYAGDVNEVITLTSIPNCYSPSIHVEKLSKKTIDEELNKKMLFKEENGCEPAVGDGSKEVDEPRVSEEVIMRSVDNTPEKSSRSKVKKTLQGHRDKVEVDQGNVVEDGKEVEENYGKKAAEVGEEIKDTLKITDRVTEEQSVTSTTDEDKSPDRESTHPPVQELMNGNVEDDVSKDDENVEHTTNKGSTRGENKSPRNIFDQLPQEYSNSCEAVCGTKEPSDPLQTLLTSLEEIEPIQEQNC